MSATSPPTEFDVAVLGGGMAGLTAAALLAKRGRRVVLVEQHDRPGGHVRSVIEDGYRIDPAVHFVMGGNADGPFGPGLLYQVMQHLGIWDRCPLRAADGFYRALLPGIDVSVPTGRDEVIAALTATSPQSEDGLRRLLTLQADIFEEFLRFPVSPNVLGWITAPLRFRQLVRHRNATVEEVVGQYLTDPRTKAAFTALWPYLGLPPRSGSFVLWAVMMASFFEEGAYYCDGGFQRLADAFADGAVEHGADVRLGTRATRIHTDETGVRGLELEGGDRVTASTVVSTTDARATVRELLERDAVPAKYRRRLEAIPVSMSVQSLYLGADLDMAALEVAPETVVSDTADFDAAFVRARRGEVPGVTVTIPTLADASLAPSGRHLVSIMGVAGEPSEDSDPERAEQFLELAERVVPDLSEHVVMRYPADGSLHRIDAIYGWDTSPPAAGIRRLGQDTPIPGLYLAGHWTQPGHGIWTVVASGVRAARLVLGEHVSAGLYPLLR